MKGQGWYQLMFETKCKMREMWLGYSYTTSALVIHNRDLWPLEYCGQSSVLPFMILCVVILENEQTTFLPAPNTISTSCYSPTTAN